MWILETVAVAFGLYSALPAPRFAWNRQNMRCALAAFPLVGAALGLACWGWAALCVRIGLPELPRGAGLCALPALLTGGIHLDGYCDVSDALASHAPPAKKREILRDPRCGAFAVIRLCVYYIAYFALCCSLSPTAGALACLGLGFVLSRALSGLALTLLPIAEGSSLAKAFAEASDRRRVRAILSVLSVLCCAGLLCCGGWPLFSASLVVTFAVSLRCRYTALKDFGGVSGDLAGWFLVKEEFWLLAALAAVQSGGWMP